MRQQDHSVPPVIANGATIPALGLGTSPMRGETCRRAVLAALGCGYRLIDTAAMYGNEGAVGSAIRASGVPRAEIFITTKVWRSDLASARFQKSAEASVQRLGVDHVDLLLIHWPNESVPLAETIGALNEALRRGLTAHIGVANFPTAMLREAVRLSEAPLVANQVEYHPYLDQSRLLQCCREHGLALIAYSPFRKAGTGSPLTDPLIVQLARSKRATPAQIVLKWLLQQSGVAAIPRSSDPDRIAENADLFDVTLSSEEMDAIRQLVHPEGRQSRPIGEPRWD